MAAFSTAPDIFASLSTLSIGYDSGFNVFGQKFKHPYSFENVERDRVFDILRATKRGFWSPSITKEMWIRAVPVDYQEMRSLGERIAEKLTNAKDVHITTEKGTDVTFSCEGMKCEPSTGPYDKIKLSGNLPTGEDEITPKPGTTNGKIVFDGGFGGLSFGNLVLTSPIEVYAKEGKVVNVKGGEEAKILSKELDFYTNECFRRAKEEGFDANVYADNVRNIGEAAVGLNKKAKLLKDSSILEWEKALRTAHVAIGYDWGANPMIGPTINKTLNHFDGVVRRPTITVDGKSLMENGWFIL